MGGLKYLLDTNVLSEPVKAVPNASVLDHLQRHRDTWCTCAIVWRELRYGWARLPDSNKKNRIGSFLLDQARSGLIVLRFDREAADWLGSERARLDAKGTTPAYADAEIAAIAVTRGLTLVTRNTRDFRYFDGLDLENWF